MSESIKFLIVGVDGATFDVISPLVKAGLLPHFEKIIRNGVHGDLRSTTHPITPQAWSTFLTGKNAGKHGVFDFTRRRPDSYEIEFANASHRSGESVFMHLSRTGRRVGAVAIPFTYPPEPVNGFMLSGMDAPGEDERVVYPRDLFQEIKKKFGNYHIHLASPIGRKRVDERKFWEDIQAEDRNRTEISLYLWDRYPCDLFMTMYTNTDRVQHQYFTWKILEDLEKGTIRKDDLLINAYLNVDRHLGELLARAESNGRTVVMLMSDHGSGPIRRFFYLNRWLELNGYLVYQERSDGAAYHTLEFLRTMTKRYAPRKVKNFLKTFFPDVKDKMESFRFFRNIDWSKTRAYGFGMYGNIFINLRGREPQGIVSPGPEFEDLVSRLAEGLEGLRDPDTGETLVEKVYRREELYQGPREEDAPDLLIGWKDYSFYTSNIPDREQGDCFGGFREIDASDYLHVGTHRLNGIFMAMGPGVRKGSSIEGAHIADIAPTILYGLGEEIPSDMDGKVLLDIFDPAFTANRPITRREGVDTSERKDFVPYSEEESEEVKARLSGLGYL